MLLITFLQDDYINTTVLPDKKTGHYRLNHSISDFNEDINIDGIDNKWIIFSGDSYKLYRYEDKDVLNEVDQAYVDSNEVIVIEVAGVKCTLIVDTIKDEKNRYTKICFSGRGEEDKRFSIGKRRENDIVLNDSYISGNHAVIGFRDGKWYVTDLNSRNSTYVNNRRISSGTEHALNIGDIVFIVGYKFIICADFIAANIDYEKSVSGSKLSKVVFPPYERSENKAPSEPEYFYRTIDLGEKPPELLEVQLLPPERQDNKEDKPMVLAMGAALTMSLSMTLMAFYSLLATYYRTPEGQQPNYSYVVPTFIMAGSMVVSTLLWPTLNKRYTNKEKDKKEAQRRKDYQDYIMDLRASIRVMMDNEKEYLHKKYLTVDECMMRVINRDRYLWSKSINDSEFMSVVLGTGKRVSEVTVKCSDNSDAFFKDDLRYDMMQFAHEDRILDDAPITMSLDNGCICGINGEKTASYELIKEIVVQLAALYSYDELKLIFIFSEEGREKWEYTKWLPHTWNSDGSFRYIASSPDEIKELAAELEKEIGNRLDNKDNDFPKMLIIASDKGSMDSLDIMSVIMKHRTELGISFLTAFGMYNYNNSDLIIEIADGKCTLYDRRNNTVNEVTPYHVNDDPSPAAPDLERYLDMISNTRLDILNEKYQLPTMLTFLDMFRVSKVEHLNSLTRWAENNPIKSLKTEIGVSPSGDTFFMDMHEKYHGPHGLIAGTTGSGKSETIITILLSLAVNYSPDEVAFVIIDYKGGGLADAFNDVKEEIIDGKSVDVSYKLPHVVGTVTNLDGATIERACISIETEIKRRQVLFKKARKLSNEGTMDIYKYQQLRREGADLETLPHLFIVCDEFAELKADREDFMNLLVSAARIGRSLGVHLILATQKPDSVVSPQIWSNSRFKICLKVQGKEDSKAVIHCPDAAEISTTGRFFFQVGYNEVFSMGQSAWCGADYTESDDFVKNDVESVEIINNTGTVLYEKIKKQDIKADSGKKAVSQLVAVRNYLIDIAKDIEVRPLWLDPIPAKLSLRSLYSEQGAAPVRGTYTPIDPIIGKRDDLYNRIQELMTVPFSEKGNLIVYGAAGSGLDMFFITLLYSLIYSYDAEQVNIYVLDFDAGFLKSFGNAPQVGDVVIAEEEDDVRTLVNEIVNEINRRSKLFSEYRGEFSEYCKHSGKTLPSIVLMLNNYTDFAEKFDDSIISFIVYIAREGLKRGVHLVIGTASVNTNYRLKQYIQQTFMLKMNDVTDYLGILGRTGGITPSECEGSGIVKENDITYKFQTAGIFDDMPQSDDAGDTDFDAGKEVKRLCDEAVEKCGGIKAVSYTRAGEESAEEYAPESCDIHSVPLGSFEGETVYYDLSDKYITFVSSGSEKLLTSFAGYLAEAISKDKNVSVAVLDTSGEISGEDAAYSIYSTVSELGEWNRRYKQDAEERCSMLVKNSDGSYSLSYDARHVYVIINSFQKVSAVADGNVTFNNLKNIINNLPEIHYHYIILDTPENMNAERGAYFHIVKNIDDYTSLANFDIENNREWFDASGIWLGSGLASNRLFDISNAAPVLTDRDGVIIRNRKTEKRFTIFTRRA